jgi:Gram-negative porin
MSWLNRKRVQALALASIALFNAEVSSAEIEIGQAKGWTVTTDGRVNSFASHIWGDNRPEGVGSLQWVGFNETGNPGQPDADNKLSKTRIRSGFVPSTLAFNVRKQTEGGLRIATRVEIGMQIANIDPSFIANPTWMDPRSVYLDVGGAWGSVRAGRDLGLFSRGNLFMNYELGHAYGVGFPCAYERVFGGSCGHVGFGTLWPDFHAQLTYTTPKLADMFEVSVGLFDPRTVPTFNWTQTPLPRFEGEATFNYSFAEGWGVKAWGNGAWQQVGIGVDVTDPVTLEVTGREDHTQDAYGMGGGLIGYLGPAKLGFSGYHGKGLDGFEFLTFNPILVGQASSPAEDRRFRPVTGILVEGTFTLGSTWIMAGYGQAMLDRLDSDIPLDQLDAFSLIRTQTGISAGLFHRIDELVLGIDYFNASYGFDPRLATQDDGTTRYVGAAQQVHTVNAGLTVEW